MTQEDKDLLLKYLCMALPYGVIVDYKESEFETPHWRITTIYPTSLDGWIGYDERIGVGSKSGSRPFEVGQYKPYLRPMQSMTEEEKTYIKNRWGVNEFGDIEIEDNCNLVDLSDIRYFIDWLNKNMFDYRGLIEKGLALEALEGMYDLKEK